jgi:hypothetical protein
MWSWADGVQQKAADSFAGFLLRLDLRGALDAGREALGTRIRQAQSGGSRRLAYARKKLQGAT